MAVATGAVAGAAIGAGGGIAATLIGGIIQSRTLRRGEEAAKEQSLLDLRQRNRELSVSNKQFNRSLAETKRQFDLSAELKKEELAVTKNEYAHNAFRERVKSLTGILDKNEQLKNLYINRLSGLRN
jgi:hypothetical protein